jgi:hypothetical protein
MRKRRLSKELKFIKSILDDYTGIEKYIKKYEYCRLILPGK